MLVDQHVEPFSWGTAWKAAVAAGADDMPSSPPRVYDLRHSFASLLLARGATVHFVAKQLGHNPALTLSTYGHVIEEYEDRQRIDPEREIWAARENCRATDVRPDVAAGGVE